MTVSVGFYKKIREWVIGSSGEIDFRPFQVDGNPYKSRVFLVGAHPTPKIDSESTSESVYIDSLVYGDLFEELYGYQIVKQSREYSGTLSFVQWMKQEFDENVVVTYVNALQTNSAEELKQARKQMPDAYFKGQQIFKEVVHEFQPDTIILHGTQAVQQFRLLLDGQLIDDKASIDKVQHLEELGVFAEIQLENGHKIQVLACRSMRYFGKDGASFANFKERIRELYV
ncbi:RNA 2'-phosphotransferase [Solibacillus sp. CAU 1738]|uniref:RNA 2'-phosphotransferase n=1 Tax=Solibacillus sp. CAU 1738 TaxID=3140363 RepID=UPI0032615D21